MSEVSQPSDTMDPEIEDEDESAFLKQPVIYKQYEKLHVKPPTLLEEPEKKYEELIESPQKRKYPYKYDPHYSPNFTEDLWTIIRGFRNGFMYGIKIRLPHAFVMTLLFNRTNVSDMSKLIFKKTKEHSIHLGQYVALYKICVIFFRRLLQKSTNNYPIIHLLAGALAGGIIWGEKTSVNHQINLYVFSRIVFGLARSGIERGYWKNYGNKGYILFASIIWAIVMYLFEFEQHNIQRSLAASMEYLYHNEDTISDISLMAIWDWVGFGDLLRR